MIKSKGIEFTVEALTPSLNVLVVQGRCTQDLIKVGDVFESVYRYTPAQTLKDYGQPGERIAARPVRLRVESIQAYRHTLEELDPGLTAELQLSGTGRECIEAGERIGNTKPLFRATAPGSAATPPQRPGVRRRAAQHGPDRHCRRREQGHQEAERGVTIIKVLDLEALSRDKVYERGGHRSREGFGGRVDSECAAA